MQYSKSSYVKIVLYMLPGPKVVLLASMAYPPDDFLGELTKYL